MVGSSGRSHLHLVGVVDGHGRMARAKVYALFFRNAAGNRTKMTSEEKPVKSREEKIFKGFETLIEVFGWLQIVASPLLIGIILGGLIYLADRTMVGMVLGICTATIGLIVGVVWATNEWRGKGTIRFMSRLIANPELNDREEEEEAGTALEEGKDRQRSGSDER